MPLEVVKALRGHTPRPPPVLRSRLSVYRAAPRRRRLDADPVVGQADQRTGEGLFQLGSAPCAPFQRRPGPTPPAGLRPCRVPPAPHDRHRSIARSSSRTRISSGIAAKAARRNSSIDVPDIESLGRQPRSRRFAVSQREIALGAIDQDFHRGVGPGKPRRQPRQIAAIATLGGERRHQRAKPRPGEIQVAVGRIVGEAELCLFERRDQLRFRNIQEWTRQPEAIALADCRAIAARPAMPLPRSRRISSVSA